jgi:hypothetical protein
VESKARDLVITGAVRGSVKEYEKQPQDAMAHSYRKSLAWSLTGLKSVPN